MQQRMEQRKEILFLTCGKIILIKCNEHPHYKYIHVINLDKLTIGQLIPLSPTCKLGHSEQNVYHFVKKL